ncbi:conserved hypothetical protein [Culex quinquefasciatus]|uniref:Uncharacterized protein n=1 Tax=Culex quinquefasciatus TaxID=7176 RepID=B0XHF2_CULQU|nr:conserved hypothetical protein [Culex quinquefasciatus]|eukprot:XP_001869074.1 conserved hypothetical protein [Culex quinquefasciatus]
MIRPGCASDRIKVSSLVSSIPDIGLRGGEGGREIWRVIPEDGTGRNRFAIEVAPHFGVRKIFSFILATSKQLPATMTSVRPRENTFKVDLSVFPKRPSFEEIHSFVHDVMGLRIDQVKRLQMNHVQNAAHVKCDTLKTAQDAVEEHDGRHEIELNKVKYKVRLQMDDSTVEVKVHDLSENVRDEELIGFLRHYGDVHCIKELVWGGNFAYKGISSGIRVVRMTLRKHIQSFVTVQQEKTLVTYRGQPQTCRHCSRLSHPGITCTDNKKLVGQKSDLSDRLKAAQSTDSTSYATATKIFQSDHAGNHEFASVEPTEVFTLSRTPVAINPPEIQYWRVKL